MGQPKRKEREGTDAPGSDEGAPPSQAAERWALPAPLSPFGKVVLGALLVLFNVPLLHYYVFRSRPEAPLALPYQNDFSDPSTVQKDFFSTGSLWRVESGELLAPGAKNNPLWLKAKLPQNVAVEFTVRSMSPEGDIKAEIFGDGSDHASGYVLIHGGWGNSLSIIARLDEHGPSAGALMARSTAVAQQKRLDTTDWVKTGVFRPDTRMRVEATPYKVELGRKYRWRLERRGAVLTWLVDGREFMRFEDPFPLAGPDHDRFGFSSWEAQLYFDDLRVEAL